MPPRIVLTDSDLLAFSQAHLLYELQIFRWIVENFPRETSFRRSVFVESFAIHLRNLIDFFYNSPALAREDDIVAADFFDVPTRWNLGVLPITLENARERANKEISHITYKRKAATDPTKPWPVADLYEEINNLALQFAAGASPKKLDPAVSRFLNAPRQWREFSWRMPLLPARTLPL
jgi:hypothetical protein